VPKGDDVEAVGLDRAVELIRIREAKGPVKRKKKAKKKAAKKKTAKKKTAKKKATKKKTTKKVSPEEPS
jgi:DNA topoisomerase-1